MQFSDKIPVRDRLQVLRYREAKLASLGDQRKLGSKGYADLAKIRAQIEQLQGQV